MSPSAKYTIFLVDRDSSLAGVLEPALGERFQVRWFPDADSARSAFQQKPAEIVIVDPMSDESATDRLMDWLQVFFPTTIRILTTVNGLLSDALEAMNSGRVHRVLSKPVRPDQLREVIGSATRLIQLERNHERLLQEMRKLNIELELRVQERTQELEAAYRELQQKNLILQKMALTDPLTNLPNRRAMDRLVRTELLQRTRKPTPLCVGLIDADHFKEINSRYLLSGGDHVLVWLGQTLAKSVRAVDSIGRVGGEEFMLVAPETGVEGAHILAERIRRTIENSHTVYDGHTIRVTVSLGVVALSPEQIVSYDALRHAAAEALSEAKCTGRNRAVVREFSPTPGYSPLSARE